MNIVIKKYNESYIKLDADIEILKAISTYFIFKADNYQFHPKYKTGVWDGNIRLYNLNKNLFPLGLLFKLYIWLKKRDIDIEYINFDKSNTVFTEQEIISFSEDKLKFPFPLRDYQIDGVQIAIKERKCIILSPTATGKSAIIYAALRMILNKNRNFKVLIMVPTIHLVDQIAGDFDDYSVNLGIKFSDYCQKIYGGETKQLNKQIIISTWQSLQNLDKSFFTQLDGILVDECHTGSTDGKVIKRLVEYCSKAKYKIGLSGSLHESKMNEYSLNGIYGKIYRVTNTRREIERGNLTDLRIHDINIRYSKEESQKLFQKKMIVKKSFDGEKYGAALYHAEINFVNSLPHKRNLIENICRKQKNNILVLFRRNSQFGDKLFKQLNENLPDRKVFLVNGATDKDIRNEVRRICEKIDNAIIVANYGVFSTGVNIKNLHHIIFAESIKSKITVLQSIGRGLRKHVNKIMLFIYDIVDDLTHKGVKNSLVKHVDERDIIYKKEGFKVLPKVTIKTEQIHVK